jgi:cell division protein FtsL
VGLWAGKVIDTNSVGRKVKVKENRFTSVVLATILWIAVVASAIAVIYTTHKSRQLFNALEGMKRGENELQVEWGQLLLEKSTWSAQVRIERLAETRLDMVPPDPSSVTMVKP